MLHNTLVKEEHRLIKKTQKSLSNIELCFVVCYIVAYLINPRLFIALLGIVTIYMLSNRNMVSNTALLLFILPFSATFKADSAATSYFFYLKIVYICSAFIRGWRLNRKIVLSVLAFSTYLLVLLIMSDIGTITRLINIDLWIITISFVYLILDGRENAAIGLKSFIISVIVTCIIGAFRRYIPLLDRELIAAIYLNEVTNEFVSRFIGLWNDPNGLTVFLITALFACLYLQKNHIIGYGRFLICAAILTIAGLATLSKSCILLLAVFWAYFMLISKGKVVYKIITCVLAIAVGGYVISNNFDAIQEIAYRFLYQGSRTRISALTSNRDIIWRDYFASMTLLDWIFGRGLQGTLINGHASHNTYIQMLFDTGIIGSLGLLITMSSIFCKPASNERNIRRDKNRALMTTGAMCLLSTLVAAFFISLLYNEYIYFIICISFVLLNTSLEEGGYMTAKGKCHVA